MVNSPCATKYSRKTEEQILVVLGQTDFRKKRFAKNLSNELVQVHKVRKIYLHPLFAPPPKAINDIAILEIKDRDIEFTSYVQPTCLPHPYNTQYTDDVAVALGN